MKTNPASLAAAPPVLVPAPPELPALPPADEDGPVASPSLLPQAGTKANTAATTNVCGRRAINDRELSMARARIALGRSIVPPASGVTLRATRPCSLCTAFHPA